MTEAEKDEQFYRDTESVAFPKLDDRQVAALEALGSRRTLRRGELVYKAGQRDFGLTIVLRGEIEVFEPRDGTEQILANAHERDFIGDVAMLQGTSALASARVKSDDCEVLQIPAAELRRALAELPGVGRPIVDALIMRRRRLMRDREFGGLRVIALRDTREGHQLDDFLDKNRIPHRLIEFESEPGQALSNRLHLTSRDLPVLLTAGACNCHGPPCAKSRKWRACFGRWLTRARQKSVATSRSSARARQAWPRRFTRRRKA
jgi:thioredoxin reductase (NADPH)